MKISIIIISLVFFLASCDQKKVQFEITDADAILFRHAQQNADLAREGFVNSRNFVMAWLEYSDPTSLLIPRNLEGGKDFWNAKDAAADNYPFMVLTSFFVDQEMFEGRMMEMLSSERALTSRVKSLPDSYSFSKQDFLTDELNMDDIVFGTSEYIKDGLLPLTEWLGSSPWSERMIEMLVDLNEVVDVTMVMDQKSNMSVPQNEVNGEMLQVLSRIYWMTGNEELLEWAIQIGDYYLLGDHHPTRDLAYLRLRDHGCELISGLCELYITTHYARPEKKREYQAPIHEMLDRILEAGRNEDGLFYDGINPMTGKIVQNRIADTWGYTLNGFYGVYLIDGNQEYKGAIEKVFSNLHKYKNYDWEGGSSDGYADAIESALNLYNRIPDPKVADWIDSEIKVMWGKQQDNGIIEGWHGDGNFARTTIMYNLWKSKGLYAKPWREDLRLGAEQKGDSLLISIQSAMPWEGKLFFDKKRHKTNLNLPVDWPRINQFPEWFTVDGEQEYALMNLGDKTIETYKGAVLMSGIALKTEGQTSLVIRKN